MDTTTEPLTYLRAHRLAELMTATGAHARLRYWPAGADGPKWDGVLRAFMRADDGRAFIGPDQDIRTAYLWVSGTMEHFLPVTTVLAALANAATQDDETGPMALLERR